MSIVAIERLVASPYMWVPALGVGAAFLIVDFAFKRAHATTYMVSEVGVRQECHYITDEFNELPFDRIADVSVSWGLLGRIFRFGTVTVRSGSVSFQSILFKGVRQPEELRQMILDAREKALAK